MAEERVYGSGGRMSMGGLERITGGGTSKLDRSLTTAEKMFDKFADVLSNIVGTLSSASSGGAHRATSQSISPIPNGGFTSPTTQPTTTPLSPAAPSWSKIGGNWVINPTQGAPGSSAPAWSWSAGGTTGEEEQTGNGGIVSPTTGGTGGPPRHRAPTQFMNGGNWGRKGFGLAAVGLAAFTAHHYSNQFLEQSLASQYAYGSDFSPAADAMFRNNYTAFNPQDAAQAANIQATMGGYAPGSSQYAAQRTANQSISYADPTISNTQSAQAAVGFQNPSTFNRLQTLGINPINQQGVVDIHQLAMQILAKLPWYHQIKTGDQIQAELYNPAGSIYVTLQSFMANGMIPTQSFKAVQAAIGDILRAQIKGVSPQRLSQLERLATDENNGFARTTLNQLGIGNSLAQTSKTRAGESMNTEIDTLGGFTYAVKETTQALTGLRGVINQIMETTHTGGLVGGGSGVLGTLGDVFKTGGGYLLGRGLLSAIKGGGGGTVGRFGGSALSKFGGWGKSLAGRVGTNLNPFNTGGFGDDVISPGETSGSTSGGWWQVVKDIAKQTFKKGIESGPKGGMAPFMSSGLYSASQVRGIGSNSAQRGGRGFGSGGAAPNQSRQDGGGGGKSSAGSGGAGISFIPPGPGVDSLDGETDFGPRNIGQGFHTGIDLLRGMQGATIKASADGVVSAAGWGASGDSGYGNTVMIDHGGGYTTMYAHMATISVSKGANVRQGQGIGTVGDTGSYSQGPHCHFELHINGKPVDPVPYISGKRGAYTGPVPGGNKGQTTTAQGTGTTLGSATAFANGNKYGSTEEVDALASIIAGMSPSGSSSSTSTGSSGSGSSGSRSGSGSSPLPPGGKIQGGSLSPSQAKVAAQKLLSQYGWGMDQFSYLDKLWTRESGWQWNATNPSSGAYGIPQSLPASKMAAAGADWRTNAVTQERWGLGYIKDRYHSPSGAWAHSEATGWYAKGAWELVSDQLAHVHKGEMILPSKVAKAVRSELTAPMGAGGSGGASIVFSQGAIIVTLSGYSDMPEAAYDVGKRIVDAVADDARIKELTTGRAYGG